MVPQLGVRVRSVLIAVVVVAVAMVLGGTGLVYALQANLEQAVEATGRARAAEITSRITADGLTATSAALGNEPRTDAVTEILATDGAVIGSSRRATGSVALSPQRPAVGTYASVELDLDGLAEGGDWEVITTALTAAAPSSTPQTYYVQVAVPIRIQRDTVQAVAILLLIGTPLLLAFVAAAVWILVGRALRSVDQIRRTVAEIDARALEARLDVPRTRDEIAALAVTMNDMLDRLHASDRAQRAFVSDASHELRSPLASLSTAAELALRSDSDATRTRLLRTMNTELARMRGLVSNLMILARADAHDLALAPAEVDLDDLIMDEVARLRSTSTLEITVVITPVRVWADRSRLAQPLRNLIDNAERHARSRVRIGLSASGDEARITVDNDGPLIEPADRERIFERFVRLDDSRSRDAGGSGLGLAIARAGLVSQGGSVGVADAPDGWCRFLVRLPLRAEAVTAAAVEHH